MLNNAKNFVKNNKSEIGSTSTGAGIGLAIGTAVALSVDPSASLALMIISFIAGPTLGGALGFGACKVVKRCHASSSYRHFLELESMTILEEKLESLKEPPPREAPSNFPRGIISAMKRGSQDPLISQVPKRSDSPARRVSV